PDVERGLIGGRELATTLDLCPPRQSRPHGKTRGEGGRLIHREQRSRPNERHVSKQNVIELRQLIEPGPAQELAEPRVAFGLAQQSTLAVMRGTQRAELVKPEGPSTQPGTLLPENDGKSRIQCHGHKNNDHDRRKTQNTEPRRRRVEGPLQ